MSSVAISLPPVEHELLRQIAQGDEQAFDHLYQLYHQPVYYYALSLVKEPTAAEEILQDVFLAVWQGADRFRRQAQVKTWLLRIAHHRAVSWLRRNKNLQTLDEIEELPAEAPLANRFTNAQIEQLQAALAQLAPKQRAVVELAFVHNLSYTEIAEVIAAPVGTVKSRMSYALRRLAQLLEQESA